MAYYDPIRVVNTSTGRESVVGKKAYEQHLKPLGIYDIVETKKPKAKAKAKPKKK